MSDEPILNLGTGKAWWWTNDDNGTPNHPPAYLSDVIASTFTTDTPTSPPTPPNLDDLAELARDIANTPPPPQRLEVGAGVADYLRAHIPAPASPIPDLWGVPIVEISSLPPGAWRLVDADGEVRRAGLIPRGPRHPTET